MAQILVTPSIIAKEAALQVVNNMVMGNLVHRDFKNEFVKVGDTISYRKPVKFIVSSGADVTTAIQDIEEYKDTIKVDQRKNVAFEIPSVDLTMTIEQISERYIKPASIRLANKIDADGLALDKKVYNSKGTPGTTPNTFELLGGPSEKLNLYAVPMEDRGMVLNPKAHFQAANVMKGLYNPEMVKGAFQSNRIGPIAGMDTYMDQNVQAHTRGTAVDTNALINGTITAATGDPGLGQDITTDGWGASVTTIKAGDIVTFAGVYGVNPVSYQSTGELQEFVVTADVSTTVTTGTCTINVVPALITSGAHQTVTNVPADNAVIDLYGTASP